MTAPATPDWTDPDVPLGAGIDFTDPNSPLARYYLSTSQVVAVAVVVLLTLFVALLPLAPSDIWGHLALGRWMAEHRALPDREPLNPYTDKTAPLFHPAWAAQVGYHQLFALGQRLAGGDTAGGVELVRAGHPAVVGLTLALLCVAYRRASGSRPLAVIGVFVVFVLNLASFGVQRPQALGGLCFAGLLACVVGESPVRRAWLLVPLVFVAWSNLHGSWTVGLLLLASLTVGRAIDVWSVRDPVFLQRLLLLGLAGLAVCVNPYGPTLYPKAIAFAGHPNLATVGEWQPLDPDRQVGAGIIYLLVLGAVLAAFAVGRRPVAAGELLAVLAFAAWPLFQQRGMLWWVLLVPTIVLPRLAVWTPQPSVPSFRKTLLVGLLVAVGLLTCPLGQWVRTGKPAAGPPTVDVNWDAGRVFADEVSGEQLQWAAPPGHGPTLFTHAHLFPPRHWEECRAAVEGGGGWPELLDRLRIRTVVIDPKRPLADRLREHPGWTAVSTDPRSPRVFVRNPAGAP